jgi:hypothetical protein
MPREKIYIRTVELRPPRTADEITKAIAAIASRDSLSTPIVQGAAGRARIGMYRPLPTMGGKGACQELLVFEPQGTPLRTDGTTYKTIQVRNGRAEWIGHEAPDLSSVQAMVKIFAADVAGELHA